MVRYSAVNLHNFVKPLDIVWVDAWGRYGIGHKTQFQILYRFVIIIRYVMKEVGHKGFNKMWGKVLIKMCSNAIWKVIAATNLSRSLEELLSRLDKIEDGDIYLESKRCIFERYWCVFENHMGMECRTSETLHYML